MRMAWTPIRYRDFYDFPRAFVVNRSGVAYFFECRFEAEADDYGATYAVYRLPANALSKEDDSWINFAELGTFVTTVPTSNVRFDDTKRRCVDDSIFMLLGPDYS